MCLPHAKTWVKVVCYDVETVIIWLLTDPRIKESAYMFFGNNPLLLPPENLNYVEGLNTGLAYTETYKKLITNWANRCYILC